MLGLYLPADMGVTAETALSIGGIRFADQNAAQAMLVTTPTER